jgi:predicted O-methyltransferase YrrM
MKKFVKGIFNRFGLSVIKTKTYEGLKQRALPSDCAISSKKAEIALPESAASLTKTAIVNGVECPYWLAPKTYNPCHPNYDVRLAKNYPGTFYTVEEPTERTESSWTNPFFQKCFVEKIRSLAHGNPADRDFLLPAIEACSQEMRSGEDYRNFHEKYKYLTDFIDKLNATYPGEYHSGAISEEDGQFLHYCVRQLKPKIIVQTGTSNGVSCAHLAMGLAHTDGPTRFGAIDMPNIYRPDDPAFHQKMVYGVLIPPGKSSGWLIPDRLLRRFECMSGNSKELLPKLLEKIGKVDFFYHDSDHSYDHMWWEFETVLPYMNPHGLIIADNIAWSSVTWDWAQKHGLYSLNHAGSQGVVFL